MTGRARRATQRDALFCFARLDKNFRGDSTTPGARPPAATLIRNCPAPSVFCETLAPRSMATRECNHIMQPTKCDTN